MLFAKKTLTGILAGFQKTVDELDEFVSRITAEISDIQGEINDLEDVRDAKDREADRAASIRGRLAALIEV